MILVDFQGEMMGDLGDNYLSDASCLIAVLPSTSIVA